MIFQRTLYIIFLLCTIPLSALSQVSLTIEIVGLQNSNGQVHLEFGNEKGEKILGLTEKIVNKKCIVSVNNLKPGKYTFKYFHDENKNDNLDCNWIGIPKEGFGFANNAMGTFGPPSLNKTIIELKQSKTVKCTPVYY